MLAAGVYVWLVKTLCHQLKSTRKRKRIADGLYTEDTEDHMEGEQTSDTYLDRLMTMFIALATAGIGTVNGAPDVATENVVGANATQFGMVPFDLLMQYFYRAKLAASRQPPERRLTWLESLDQDERADWVSAFRDSAKPLSLVVQETM